MRPEVWLDRLRFSRAPKPEAVPPPRVYRPRAPRHRLDLRVFFEGETRTYNGQALNVSESGLIARFAELPELWTDGRIFLEAEKHSLSMTARVARLQGEDAGFAFLGITEKDRADIKTLIAWVTRPTLGEPS